MAWLDSYQYRKVLTVDSSKVDADLTDFPVLVSLSDLNFDFSHLLSSGDDIRFTDADGVTELKYEKEFLGAISTYGSDILSGGTASGDTNGGAWSNPANVVDNNDGSFGNSTDTIGDHWWKYDLGAGNEKTVAKLRFKPYNNAWGNSVKDFSIQGSNNDADWDTLYTGQHGNNNNYEEFEFANTTAYRYYRIYMTSTWTAHYLVGLYEVEMMEVSMSGNFAYFWVKVPSVLAGSDTPFYIYYGLVGDSDGQDASNVWDSYHKLVYHLTEQGNGTTDEFKSSVRSLSGYTADVFTGGTASADSENGSEVAANAFDDNVAIFWTSATTGSVPRWLKYDLGVGVTKTIERYSVMARTADAKGKPTDWQFQGSNNDADWDVLDTQSSITWSGDGPQIFSFSNSTAYRYYRLYITGTSGGVYVQVRELTGHEATTTGAVDGTAINAVTRVYGGIYTQQDFATSRISLPDNENLEHGAQDFTWSFKVTFDATGGNQCMIGRDTSGTSYFYFALESGSLRFRDYNSGNVIDFSVAPGTLTAGVMYDIEVVRSGSSWKIYKDNVQLGSTATDSDAFVDRTQGWVIGGHATINYHLNGKMDEVRMSIGIARSDAWRKARIAGDDDLLLTYGSEEEIVTSAAPGALTPELAWSTYVAEQLTPALQWSSIIRGELAPELSWKASAAHKFMPNIVNYPFYFANPSVTSSAVPLLISGCSVGFSMYLKNTGSSGQTTVKVYAGGTLKATKTIAATGTADSYIEYFDLDSMFNPLETFEVEITEAAVGSEDLKVNMYLMTFPFEMDKLFYGNLDNSVLFKGINKEYIFNEADYWTIDFNQPIFSVASVIIEDETGDITDATYSLIDGVFFNSRLKLTPHTSSKPRKISVKLQDYNERYHVFELEPKVRNSYGDYPSYIAEATKDVELFIAAKSYRYSFDGGSTWSIWANVTNDNQIMLDFSGESLGDKTVDIQYTIGDAQVSEQVSIYYLTGDIDVDVIFAGSVASVEYMDEIPLDKIEVYYDTTLVDSLTIPVITGFGSLASDSALGTITPASGTLYYNTEKYTYDGSAITLAPDFASNNYAVQWRVIFGFDTVEKVFDVRYVLATNPFDNNYEGDKPANFIRLWVQDFIIRPTGPNYSPWNPEFFASPVFTFEFGKIDINLLTDTDITIRVIDIAGREQDFTLEYIRTKYNVWRSLTVTPTGGGDEILPGQIHQESSLTYDIDSEDWEDPTGGV